METKRNYDEFEAQDILAEQRSGNKIQGVPDLAAYIKNVEENFGYGYGVAPRAIAQAALATAFYLCDRFGLTGFQAGFVMWDFIRGWMFKNNKCGLKIVNYDDMLYPQYEDKFEKIISPDIWVNLQKEAAERLKTSAGANQHVVAHLESIVRGEVPFGYVVKKN